MQSGTLKRNTNDFSPSCFGKHKALRRVSHYFTDTYFVNVYLLYFIFTEWDSLVEIYRESIKKRHYYYGKTTINNRDPGRVMYLTHYGLRVI